jgi:RimJ/RimL family protein N-acetyltransferase
MSGQAPTDLAPATGTQPTLFTRRLLLRAFDLNDAPNVQILASAHEVADTSLNIAHPYRGGMAEAWILTHRSLFRSGVLVNYAITLESTGNLIGAIGLRIQPAHNRAELGYWIGVPHWNQGYCTEAASAVVAYAFEELGLHRVHAAHLRRNTASGRVLQKIGMTYEGSLREHARKWDRYEDIEKYGMLRSEYQERKAVR